PVAGSQTPGVWHWSWAVQTTLFVPVHAPARQMSVSVHALPSLHALPSAARGFEHTPVARSHRPATCHWSWAVHTTGTVPTQPPSTHVSSCVRGLPALQGAGAKPVTGQPPDTPSQTPFAVQTLPSSQAVPAGTSSHVGEQQSPATRLPSSHCSPRSRTP